MTARSAQVAYPAGVSAGPAAALRALWARRGPAIALAAGALALVALQLWLARGATGPWTTHDEPGFLAAARYFSGAEVVPVLESIPFYHPGYSLLLAPLDALLSSPADLYRAALVLNAVLVGLLAVPLFALARLLGLGAGRAVLAALAAAAYPGFLIGSQTAWAESLFQLLFASFAVLAVLAAARPGMGRAGALAGLAGAMYLVHPRAAGIVLVTLGFLVALAAARRLSWRALAVAVAAAAIPVAATHLLKRLLLERIYAPDPARDGVGDALAPLVEPARWGDLALALAGQSWYLTVATLGLAPVGAAALAAPALRAARAALRRRELDAPGAAAGLVLAAALSVLAVSSLWIGANVTRVDHLVFGRYNEGFVAVLMVVGLAALLAGSRRRNVLRVGAAAALGLALGLVVHAGHPPEAFTGPLAPVTVVGILVYVADPDTIEVVAVGAAAAAFTLGFGAAAAGSRRLAVAGAGLFFALSAAIVQDEHVRPYLAPQRDLVDIREAVSTLRPLGPISYDLASNRRRGVRLANAYQFWLPESRFTLFDSRLGQRPETALVIAGRTWPEGVARGARGVFPETGNAQTLWALPGPAQDALARRGLLVPAHPAAPLPEAAYRADVTVAGRPSLRLAPGDGRTVRLRVRHAGAGSPWVALDAVADRPDGAVRVSASWHRRRPGGPGPRVALQRAELPRTVLPGESVPVELPLEAAGDGGRPLPPGDYLVDVNLYQAGVRAFDRGVGSDLTVRVG